MPYDTFIDINNALEFLSSLTRYSKGSHPSKKKKKKKEIENRSAQVRAFAACTFALTHNAPNSVAKRNRISMQKFRRTFSKLVRYFRNEQWKKYILSNDKYCRISPVNCTEALWITVWRDTNVWKNYDILCIGKSDAKRSVKQNELLRLFII